MISVARASALIEAQIRDLGTEHVLLSQAAGRILRQRITAERDQPPFDRVMMDGIAFASGHERREFRIAGTAFAGDPQMTLEHPDECVEVMTGTALPRGCDTIVPVEQISVKDGRAQLSESCAYQQGQFIHRRASDHPSGAVLLEPGIVLGGPEIAVVASAGLPDVAVGRTPRTTIISTGNELVAGGEPIAGHQIRLSNGPAIAASLRLHGIGSAELHLSDSPTKLEWRLSELLHDNDMLILSGGVSMGKADHVPTVLEKLGVQRVFHKVAQRPGKPMWFGVATGGCLVFGLPGNPVSAMVCTRRYILPALLAQSGRAEPESESIVLGHDVESQPALTVFAPVVVKQSLHGPRAHTVTVNTSGDFTALAGTSGVVELSTDQNRFPAGSTVPFFRWNLVA